uniref:UDP-glycosyltransferase 73E1-like n=1 Tax=Erigeron canadensis TaxID=72917 RepID=UPI001CB937EA|nr:UDP-glycosyltransferase 73E1-like [Erigeron canadensis]
MAGGSINYNLHFVLFPYYESGHMLPMVDIARILAQRGATVTIVTTPAGANRLKPTINRATIEAKHKIQLLELALPLAEFGLPEGFEDSKLISHKTAEQQLTLYRAMESLQKPAEDLLRDQLATPPDCIIADFFFPWATEVARKFEVPRLVVHGQGCFSLVCLDVIAVNKIRQGTESETEKMVLPGLPDRVEVTKLKIRGRSSTLSKVDFGMFTYACMQAERAAFGTLVNSFKEVEPEYAKKLQKRRGSTTQVYCVGPVSLYNNNKDDDRGSKAAIDDHYCLQWLNQREAESVLYVSFGSVVPVSTKQSIELGLGLEATNKPFIWCVRTKSKQLEEWFSESRFEERVRGRGLIIHGWAPQLLILSHPSVGGFLTHCGWNSLVEAICAGVPIVTWPIKWDQFYNEIYMVQILKIGVSVGVEEALYSDDFEDMEPLVNRDSIKTAVNRLLDEEHGIVKECRQRVRKLAQMAKGAMAQGGSSYLSVSKLFQDVSDFRRRRRRAQENKQGE